MSIETGAVVAIRPGPSDEGLGYFVGVSAQTAGSVSLRAHLITIPPGGRARAHLHSGHETAIYMLEGEVMTWYGDGLADSVITKKVTSSTYRRAFHICRSKSVRARRRSLLSRAPTQMSRKASCCCRNSMTCPTRPRFPRNPG